VHVKPGIRESDGKRSQKKPAKVGIDDTGKGAKHFTVRPSELNGMATLFCLRDASASAIYKRYRRRPKQVLCDR